jgi:hypothetical protein
MIVRIKDYEQHTVNVGSFPGNTVKIGIRHLS